MHQTAVDGLINHLLIPRLFLGRGRFFITRYKTRRGIGPSGGDGIDVLYIARAAVNNLLSVDIGRGSRLPAWATSMGRVLLSALPEELLEVTLSRAQLLRYTPHTICDLAALREEIARVRIQGYALADRQIEVGLCSLAVPLLSRNGTVVAALNVGVPASSMSAAALKEKALAPLRRSAMELSLQL